MTGSAMTRVWQGEIFHRQQKIAQVAFTAEEPAVDLLLPKQLAFNQCTDTNVLLNSILPEQLIASRRLPWSSAEFANGCTVQLWYGRSNRLEAKNWKKFMSALHKQAKVALHSLTNSTYVVLVPLETMRNTFDNSSLMADQALNDSRAGYCIVIKNCPVRLASLRPKKQSQPERNSSEKNKSQSAPDTATPQPDKPSSSKSSEQQTKVNPSEPENLSENQKPVEMPEISTDLIKQLSSWIAEGNKIEDVEVQINEESKIEDIQVQINERSKMEEVQVQINEEQLGKKKDKEDTLEKEREKEDEVRQKKEEEMMKLINPEPPEMQNSHNLEDGHIEDSVEGSKEAEQKEEDMCSMLAALRADLTASESTMRTKVLVEVLDQTIALLQQTHEKSTSDEEAEVSNENLREKHQRDARKRASRMSMLREIAAPNRGTNVELKEMLGKANVAVQNMRFVIGHTWRFLEESSKCDEFSKSLLSKIEDSEVKLRAEHIRLIKTQTSLLQVSNRTHPKAPEFANEVISVDSMMNYLQEDVKVQMELILCMSHYSDGKVLLQSLVNKQDQLVGPMQKLLKDMDLSRSVLGKVRRFCPTRFLDVFSTIEKKSQVISKLISTVLEKSECARRGKNDIHLPVISKPLKSFSPPRAYRCLSPSPKRRRSRSGSWSHHSRSRGRSYSLSPNRDRRRLRRSRSRSRSHHPRSRGPSAYSPSPNRDRRRSRSPYARSKRRSPSYSPRRKRRRSRSLSPLSYSPRPRYRRSPSPYYRRHHRSRTSSLSCDSSLSETDRSSSRSSRSSDRRRRKRGHRRSRSTSRHSKTPDHSKKLQPSLSTEVIRVNSHRSQSKSPERQQSDSAQLTLSSEIIRVNSQGPTMEIETVKKALTFEKEHDNIRKSEEVVISVSKPATNPAPPTTSAQSSALTTPPKSASSAPSMQPIQTVGTKPAYTMLSIKQSSLPVTRPSPISPISAVPQVLIPAVPPITAPIQYNQANYIPSYYEPINHYQQWNAYSYSANYVPTSVARWPSTQPPPPGSF